MNEQPIPAALDRLRRELTVAAERQQSAAGRTARHGFVPGAFRRPLVLAATGLLLTGTATATVVSVVTRDSGSSRGTIPPVTADRAAPGEYAVRFAPYLRVGRTGWCSTVTLTSGGRFRVGSTGCGAARLAPTPVESAGGIGSSDLDQRTVFSLIVSAQVAAVRLGDLRVIPRPDPALPAAYRIVVLTPPGGTAEPRISIEDTTGKVTRLEDTLSEDAPNRPVRTGPGGPYEITATTGTLTRQHTVEGPLPGVRGLTGPAFVSVADGTLRLGDQAVRVTRLLGAADPTADAPDLPGARPLTGRSDVVRIDARTLATRDGRSWLVATARQQDAASAALADTRTTPTGP